MVREGGPQEGTPPSPSLGPHRLEQADVLPQGAHAAAEGDEEGEDADHDQQDGRVHRQAGQRRLCHGQLSPTVSVPPPRHRRHPPPGCPSSPPSPPTSPACFSSRA